MCTCMCVGMCVAVGVHVYVCGCVRVWCSGRWVQIFSFYEMGKRDVFCCDIFCYGCGFLNLFFMFLNPVYLFIISLNAFDVALIVFLHLLFK